MLAFLLDAVLFPVFFQPFGFFGRDGDDGAVLGRREVGASHPPPLLKIFFVKIYNSTFPCKKIILFDSNAIRNTFRIKTFRAREIRRYFPLRLSMA